MAAAAKAKARSREMIATNRKGRRDFHVLETFEAGIALRGTEVKSIRAGDVSLNESYARIEDGEVLLHAMHVSPYKYGRASDQEPRRPRRLLLHRQEIRKLVGQVAEKGRTLVPLGVYLKGGRIKVELALCQGKLGRDKRETLKRKTADREARRAVAEQRKR